MIYIYIISPRSIRVIFLCLIGFKTVCFRFWLKHGMTIQPKMTCCPRIDWPAVVFHVATPIFSAWAGDHWKSRMALIVVQIQIISMIFLGHRYVIEYVNTWSFPEIGLIQLCHPATVCLRYAIDMSISPVLIHFHRNFHHEQSILGSPHFSKPPYRWYP